VARWGTILFNSAGSTKAAANPRNDNSVESNFMDEVKKNIPLGGLVRIDVEKALRPGSRDVGGKTDDQGGE